MNTAIIVTLIICATIVILCVLGVISNAIKRQQTGEPSNWEQLKEARKILNEIKELEDK